MIWSDAFRRGQIELDQLADACDCAVCASDTMARGGPRVMSAVEPVFGESLMGLLARAARRDNLRGLRPLLLTCTSTWHVHVNLALRDDLDFDQLAFAARLPRHEVAARRYLPLQITPELPGISFHGAMVPRYDLRMRYRRLAPSWLTGGGIHYASAHHGLVTHCPISGDLFVDRCPRCTRNLTWATIELERCGGCGTDLRAYEPARVDPVVMRKTRLMIDLVHSDPTRHLAAAADLPATLRDLNRGEAFELGWRFGCVITGYGVEARDEAKRLPVETRLTILAAGSAVLAEWPLSLNNALRGRVPGRDDTDDTLPARILDITKVKNVWPGIKDAIRAVTPAAENTFKAAIRRLLPGAANSAELTRNLGVSQQIYERMRDLPGFEPVAQGGTINRHPIYDTNQFGDLRDLLADHIAFAAASERLDISHNGIEQLCCLGKIVLIDDEIVRVALKQRQIRRSSLNDLIAELKKDRRTVINDPVPLHHALCTVGEREKPWGPIVAAMLSGALPFTVDTSREGRLMNRISICRHDIPRIAAMTFDPSAWPDFAFNSRINRRDTEQLLNVDPSTFSRAVKAGEAPTSTNGSYDRATVLKLASHLISGREILARWTKTGKRFPEPLRGPNRLRRIGQLGWRRADVDHAMKSSATCLRSAARRGTLTGLSLGVCS